MEDSNDTHPNKSPPPVPGRGINREYLLLQNFVENERRQRAKVLRNQQLEKYYNYEDDDFANEKTKYPTRVTFNANVLVEEAIVNGNKYEVLNLIKNGLPLSYTNSHDMSLLHLACMYDDYIIAQALMKEGISCNAVDSHGWTPLHVCAAYDSIKCAQLLVSSDANLLAMDCDNSLAVDLASLHGHLRSNLLKNINSKCKMDEVGLRNLQTVGYKRMAKDVKSLLERNQNIDQPITHGMTLLHIATCHGYLSLVKVLLNNNANVNAVDDDLWTPLHCAAKSNQVQGVKLLLAYYANPHSRTSLGHMPADLASVTTIRNKLFDAEQNFLDLSQQRTPAKTKRFSASLLDQNDEEEQQAMRVKTRVIRNTPISAIDIKRENEVVERNKIQLKQVLQDEKNQTATSPQSTNTSPRRSFLSPQLSTTPYQNYDSPQYPTTPYQGYNNPQYFTNSYQGYDGTQNATMLHQCYDGAHDDSLPPPPSQEEMETMAAQTLLGSSYVKAVVICQRAVRNFLSRCRLERSATFCTNLLTQSTNGQQDILPDTFYASNLPHSMSYNSTGAHEEQQRMKTISNPIPVADNRRYSSDVYSLTNQWTDHNTGRPLSTGAISPNQYENREQPVWVPLKGSKTSPTHDVHLTNTVKRSLTMTATQRREHQPPKYPTVKLRRQTSGQENERTNYTMPPLTSTVATMINLAAQPQPDTNLMPPPIRPPPSAYNRVPQQVTRPTQPPPQSPLATNTLQSPRLHQPTYNTSTMPRQRKIGPQSRYGTLLSNRSNILRDQRLQQSVKGPPNEYRHSWSHEKMSMTASPLRYHTDQPPVIEERKRFSDSFDGKSTEAMIDQLRQLNVRHKHGNTNNNSNHHDDSRHRDENHSLQDRLEQSSEVPPALPRRDEIKTPAKSKNPQNLQMTLSNSPLDESDLPEVPPPLQLYSDLPSPRRFLGNSNDNRPPSFSTFLNK